MTEAEPYAVGKADDLDIFIFPPSTNQNSAVNVWKRFN